MYCKNKLVPIFIIVNAKSIICTKYVEEQYNYSQNVLKLYFLLVHNFKSQFQRENNFLIKYKTIVVI